MKNQRMARSQRQEREGMLRFGGQQNPRSGAGALKKNDGRTSRNLGNELIEFKRTDNKKQITIQLVELLKVETNAINESRNPILGFDLGSRHYVVMPEEVYLERSTTVIRPGVGRDRGDDPGVGSDSPVHVRSQVPRIGAPVDKPVLRRVQGQPGGSSGKIDLPGRRVRGGRRVPREVRVPEMGSGETGVTGGMGRGLRARAAKNTPGDRPDPE